MPALLTVGIDPGYRSGAIAAVDSAGRFYNWAAVRVPTSLDPVRTDCLREVAAFYTEALSRMILDCELRKIAIEGTTFFGRKSNSPVALASVRFAYYLQGSLDATYACPIRSLSPSRWRKALTGNAQADASKLEAFALAAGFVREEALNKGLKTMRSHLVDALLIAVVANRED